MPSGSDLAYRYAIAGTSARAFSTRAGYYLRNVVPVWLNGAARSGVVQSSIRIDLNTGAEPHRCSFTLKGGGGYVPQAGHSVVIGHGTTANPLFSGRLLTVTRTAIRADDRRPSYQCEAAGHVFELATARVSRGLYAQSLGPRAIVASVLAVTSPSATSMGFTAEYVSADLSAVAEFSIGPTDDIAEKFDDLFRSIDATWYVDHVRGMRAFATSDTGPGSVPSTLRTGTSPDYWQFRITPTNLSRVFTRAHVVGATQATVADMLPSRHAYLPLASASLLGNGDSGLPLSGVTTTEDFLIGGRYENGENVIYDPQGLFVAGNASVFLPSSRGTSSLVVVSANVSSFSPLRTPRWYDIAGQYVYVASESGVFSATASSIAYAYWVHPSGPGALTSDVNAFADISAPWNMFVSASILATAPLLAAGTDVSVYATRVNSSAVAEVSSLFGSATFGVISKTFRDSRLGPDGAAAVASAALERGVPSQWLSVEFETRDGDFNIGRPVYVSVTSTAEPSGASIAGTFIAHDVTIDGFGTLTETKGPTRTVSAAAARKPTLWQILQGER